MTDGGAEDSRTWLERLAAFEALLPRGRERLPLVIAWVAGIAALLALVQRFRYATDLTDETFSIAMPYRFALGDKPFVDEIAIQQTAGIVLFPFVWLFVKLTGGGTGIVLYVRLVHLFVFKGAAALSVHAAARRLLANRAVAVAVAFVPFAFVPHSIPNVGYNVVGMSMLTAGSFLTVAGMAEIGAKRRRRLFFLARLAHGIMAFAYPPMAVAAVIATPLVLLLTPEGRWSALLAFVAGGALAVLLLTPSLLFGGVAGVKHSLGWGVHANATHDAARTKAVLEAFWKNLPWFFPYALAAVVAGAVVRSRTLVAVLIPAITLALTFWFRDDWATVHAAIRTVTYTGAFAPLLALLAKPDGQLVRAVLLVFIPAAAAALAASVVSTQGVDAASLGLASSMTLFALLAGRALEGARAEVTYCLLPALALIVALVTRCYDFVYRDSPIAHLTQPVLEGPFKGIRTTPERAQIFAEMSQIARAYDRPDGRVLFLWEASGYYLFFRKSRPSAHSVWEEHYGDLDGLLDYWQRHANGHGIVVKNKATPPTRIDSVLMPPERKIRETRHFVVYADR